jgi:SAM-dependent methyltransferase
MDDSTLPAVGGSFEQEFLSASLERQISHCEHYELAAYFRRILPSHQPILEAGCGSGRWVGWFTRQGWTAAGLDWSEARAAAERLAPPTAREDQRARWADAR